MSFHVFFPVNATRPVSGRAQWSGKNCLVMATVLGGLGIVDTACARQVATAMPPSSAGVAKKAAPAPSGATAATGRPESIDAEISQKGCTSG